jgi:predicted nuclease of predicted toxin-antitoxin system
VKLLVDANLSPRIAAAVRAAGFDSVHVAEVGLLTAADDVIFDHAVEHRLAIVTADSDFAQMLALRQAATPSVVQMRHLAELSPDDLAALLVANLPMLLPELEKGVIASLSSNHLRVRGLPIR